MHVEIHQLGLLFQLKNGANYAKEIRNQNRTKVWEVYGY